MVALSIVPLLTLYIIIHNDNKFNFLIYTVFITLELTTLVVMVALSIVPLLTLYIIIHNDNKFNFLIYTGFIDNFFLRKHVIYINSRMIQL